MTTQYTPTLKLALPVTGELSGTWGDTVNDNITSMVEQAIAGLSTINTWTGNAHALTTANGTTSESRCAMLVAATGAGGTAITAAGEITCPAAAKLYVLQNNTAFVVTLKTSAGTGVAVAAGNTSFLFCDGTNVNACVTTIVNGNVTGNLSVGGNLTVDGNTTLGNATSDTVTVTARIASDVLPSADNTYDLGSAANAWKDLYIDGTATIAILNATTLDLTNLEVTNIKAKDGTASATIADSTGVMTITTLASTTGNITTVNATTVDATNVEVTNIKAKDGTASIVLADTTGIATFSNATVISTTDNTNAALRITQLGTGNALLVEDSSNPDSTPFVITAAGDVGIGTTTPLAKLNTYQVAGGSDANILFQNFSTTTSTAVALYLSPTNGSLTGGSIRSAVIKGINVGSGVTALTFSTNSSGADPTEKMRIDSAGNVGIGTTSPSSFNVVFNGPSIAVGDGVTNTGMTVYSGTTSSGAIAFADGTTGDQQYRGRIRYSHSDDALALFTAATERMRIDSSGNVGIGTTSPTSTLSVTGTANVTGNTTLGDATTDTVTVNGYMGIGGAGNSSYAINIASASLVGGSQYGIVSAPTSTVAATSTTAAYFSFPKTAAAAYTATNVTGFFANDATKGAGSTITSQRGVYIADQTQGTNNYGITSLVSSGTDKWNIYASGTAQNYFAGNVGIGTSSPTAQLNLNAETDTTAYNGAATDGQLTAGATQLIRAAAGSNTNVAQLVFQARAAQPFNRIVSSGGTAPFMAFVTNNAERMRIDSSGDVGIGTTSPTSTLSVTGTANVTGNVTLGDATTDTVRVNGYMGVGGAADAAIGLYASSTALTGVNQDGVRSSPTGTSAATTSIVGVRAIPGTAASAFTVTNVSGFAVSNANKGAGSTITNLHGVNISDQTQGTNNYGVTSAVSSGTDKWNIYASGTAQNYFAGDVGIGTTSPAYKLDIATGAIQVKTGASVVSAEYDWLLGYSGTSANGVKITTIQGSSSTRHSMAFYTSNAASPAERMRIDNAGSLLLGLTSSRTNNLSSASLLQLEAVSSAATGALVRNSADTSGAGLILGKSRGTSVGSFTAVVSGDRLGTLSFSGTDGTTMLSAATILSEVDGTPGTNDMPGRLVFSTTADGASSPTERMRIDSSGTVTLASGSGLSIGRTAVTSPATADGNVFSGTYTPTLTNTTNIASSTATVCQYMRVGNTVTVSGSVTVDATTAGANTQLRMSLPISSTFSGGNNLGGAGASISSGAYGNSMAIFAETGTNTAEFRWLPTLATAQIYNFTFTYQVI